MTEADRRDTLQRAARGISAGCVDTEETLVLVADLESIGHNRAARAVSAGCVDTEDTLALVASLRRPPRKKSTEEPRRC